MKRMISTALAALLLLTLWGGRLPAASAADSPLPNGVPTVKSPLAVGWRDYYAIRPDGTLISWGSQEFGGFEEDVPFEQARTLMKNAAAVYTGGRGSVLAVDNDGGLWYYVDDFTDGRPGWQNPDSRGDFQPILALQDVTYAAQGEQDILAVQRDGSLWKLSPKEDGSGYPSEAVRLGGGFSVSAGANVGLVNFSPTTSYKSGQFTDVKSGDWFAPNVKSAVELGLMKGQSAAAFAPRGAISVAEAITVAVRVRDTYYDGGADFTVPAGQAWYQPYVDYAMKEQMLSHDLTGEFNRPATRAQLAWLLSRALPEEALEAVNPNISFSDVSEATHGTVHRAVMTLARAGVMQGKGEGLFDPEGTVLRCEAAAMLSRAVLPSLRVKVDSAPKTEPPLDEESLAAAAPSFLDEEQQLLYRRAHCVYGHLFGGDTAYSCIWEMGDQYPGGWGEVERNGIGYTRATGRYAAWEDFDALVHSVFTHRFWDSRNAIQRGERYINIDGAMHFILAARGMYYYNDNFPDTFRLISKTDDEITFTLTGHYSSPWPNEGESSQERDKRLTSGWDYTIDFPIKMVRTADGWRFDQFHHAAADQEEPPTAKPPQ